MRISDWSSDVCSSDLMLSLLRGRDVTPRDTLYYYYKKNDLEAVQIGKWKLVFPHQYRSYEHVLPGKDGIKGEYSLGLLDSLALFDLRRDPGERYNVAQMYPGIISKLHSAAKIARKDLGDNLQNRPGKNRRDRKKTRLNSSPQCQS